MIAYKGFETDLSCRGYQFVMGMNITDKANCAENGFHCAENPLDCLNYYGCVSKSIYCIVDTGGDVDEDGNDSKISCTELNIIKQISLEELLLHGLAYMVDHPKRELSSQVKEDKAQANNGYAVVRGFDPVVKGSKVGDILCFAKDAPYKRGIEQIALVKVDGKKILPNVWYGIDLKERCYLYD